MQQSRSASLGPTLQGILRSPGGVQQLWRGTTASILRTGLGSAIYFSSLDRLRRLLLTQQTVKQDRLSRGANLTAGAIARASAGFILMPITVIKVRYESSLYDYQSMRRAAQAIASVEGIQGFFKGAGATAVRDAPYAGLYVVFYEESKRLTFSTGSMPSNFFSGVIAAALATVMTNPFDAVKTRLQLMPAQYADMLSAASKMVRQEGWRSLMDGLGLRMGRKALSSALVWTVYEELVRRA